MSKIHVWVESDHGGHDMKAQVEKMLCHERRDNQFED